MPDKPFNSTWLRVVQAATGVSPADYPVGSLASRAAARALLQKSRPTVPEYDKDAIVIYEGSLWLCGQISPGCTEVANTAIGERGWELCKHEVTDRTGEEAIHAMSNEELHKAERVLFFSFVINSLARMHDAWERRLPELPFPLRVEGNVCLYRNSRGEWHGHEEYSQAIAENCGQASAPV